MAAYHDAPYTLSPAGVIPEDAAPAVGVDSHGHEEVIAEASAEYAPDDKIAVEVGDRGRPGEVEVTVTPATEFEDGFSIFWQWGDGGSETGPDLVQRHDYIDGEYVITATVNQPERTSLQGYTTVVIADGAVSAAAASW